jgi:hypothetical protein
MKQQEVAQNACHRLQSKLQHDVSKKAELDSECLCFDRRGILMNFLSGILNWQPNYKLRNSQVIRKTTSICSRLVFNFVKNFFVSN